MSTVIDALYQLKYNPFKYGEYIASFYSAVDNVENNLLLAPIVIPLCSHPEFKTKLEGAVFGQKKRSTIWSIFRERIKLYDLQERVDEFGMLTDKSIQYCLVNDWLAVDDEMLALRCLSDTDTSFRIQKPAVNLGKLVNGHSVVEIWAFLGVTLR